MNNDFVPEFNDNLRDNLRDDLQDELIILENHFTESEMMYVWGIWDALYNSTRMTTMLKYDVIRAIWDER